MEGLSLPPYLLTIEIAPGEFSACRTGRDRGRPAFALHFLWIFTWLEVGSTRPVSASRAVSRGGIFFARAWISTPAEESNC